MVGLGLLLLVIGIILWLTVAPVIGWILMVAGVIAAIIGLFIGATWSFGRGRRTTV